VDTLPRGRWSDLPGAPTPTRLYVPAALAADRAWTLLLHGWNQTPEEWGTRTRIAALAERAGRVLVAPRMGRSVYLGRTYADAAAAPPDEPGLTRVLALITDLEARGLAQDPSRRRVIGVSTGGRGAALLAVRGRFGDAMAFSGTYDLATLDPRTGEYRIHAAVLGPRDRNPARWRDEDVGAPPAGSVRWWLAHAEGDPHVPVAQTRAFAARVNGAQAGPTPRVRIDPGALHDWGTWDTWLAWAHADLTD
jgi:poly(3-hydroxybutyrate) depolymerase